MEVVAAPRRSSWRPPFVPLDRGEESFRQREDCEGNGSRQRQTLGTRGGVLLAVVQAFSDSSHERAQGDRWEGVIQHQRVDRREVGLETIGGHRAPLV
jgi:hypothetical protein